jgi:polar amino acid transport system substrate-binding protein
LKTIVGILILLISSWASADVVKLRTDLWCPYACDPKSDKPGFMVEIAKEIFSKHGHTVDYKLMNWSRAINDARVGKFDGVIGASRADVEGFEIPTVAAGMTSSYYWTLADNNWSYKDESSLNSKRFGVINAYSYGDEIDKLIAKMPQNFIKVAGDNPLIRMIQMTEAKRLDGFVENPYVLWYTLAKLHKNKKFFKMASKNVTLDPELFIAFTPVSIKSKNYSQYMDEGIIELRKSGRLKIILNKYGLSDWK